MTISERYRIALDRFEQEMPVAETELHLSLIHISEPTRPST